MTTPKALRVGPLKDWSLRWWQLAHQTRLREPPLDDPVFLERLYEDQRRSEVVFTAPDLLILGSNPVLALAAAARCAPFVDSLVVALARSPDHWNYPLTTTPLFGRFVQRFDGGRGDLDELAQGWATTAIAACSTGWIDLTQDEWFHLSRDDPSGLMLGLWGPPQDLDAPWDRLDESPRDSTRDAYQEVWSRCLPALERLGPVPLPEKPAFCEGPDRPAHVMASRRVLLVSSLPHRVSQTVRTTDEGLFLANEWGLPAVGSAAFVSTSARGHFETPLRDLNALRELSAERFPPQGRWPDGF